MICRYCTGVTDESKSGLCSFCNAPLGDGQYAPPAEFCYDPQSGSYYKLSKYFDVQTGQAMINILWFNPADGSYHPQDYPDPTPPPTYTPPPIPAAVLTGAQSPTPAPQQNDAPIEVAPTTEIPTVPEQETVPEIITPIELMPSEPPQAELASAQPIVEQIDNVAPTPKKLPPLPDFAVPKASPLPAPPAPPEPPYASPIPAPPAPPISPYASSLPPYASEPSPQAAPQNDAASPRKKRRVLPILLSLVVVLGLCTAATYLLRPQNKAELLATTAEENALYGNLLAAYGDWVFYADPAMGGALCAVNTTDKKAKPIAVADMTVANLNVVGDTLYFTDLAGSFLSLTQADGSVVNRAFPAERQNLTGYLDVTTRSDTLYLGGNLYCANGLKSFCDSNGQGQLNIEAISEPGSYHYNVVATEDSIKSVERIVTQADSTLALLFLTSTKDMQQPVVINLSTASYKSSAQSPQVIPLGVMPPSSDKPKEASLYEKLMDGLGLVYSKVENSFFSETKVERNEAEENYYRGLRHELERPEGHQIGNVTQVGDMIYYDSYLQTENKDELPTSYVQIKNPITGELVSFAGAGDMKRAGDKIFFKDNQSGLLMVIDGRSGGQVKAVSSTPIGNYVINSRGDIEFDYVDRQGKILPGIFSLKDHAAAYRFLKSGAPDAQIDSPYYVHLNPRNILFDNVDDWEKRNSWTGSYARGNLINPFYEDVNMQMAYKMGYDQDGNPVWIQEAWEGGVGKRKETHSFAPAVDVLKGDHVRDILAMYNEDFKETLDKLAKENPELNLKGKKKTYTVVEDYEPEEGKDWFGNPLPEPLPGKPESKSESKPESKPENKPSGGGLFGGGGGGGDIVVERIDGSATVTTPNGDSKKLKVGDKIKSGSTVNPSEAGFCLINLDGVNRLSLYDYGATVLIENGKAVVQASFIVVVGNPTEQKPFEVRLVNNSFSVQSNGGWLLAGGRNDATVEVIQGSASLYGVEGQLLGELEENNRYVTGEDGTLDGRFAEHGELNYRFESEGKLSKKVSPIFALNAEEEFAKPFIKELYERQKNR